MQSVCWGAAGVAGRGSPRVPMLNAKALPRSSGKNLCCRLGSVCLISRPLSPLRFLDLLFDPRLTLISVKNNSLWEELVGARELAGFAAFLGGTTLLVRQVAILAGEWGSGLLRLQDHGGQEDATAWGFRGGLYMEPFELSLQRLAFEALRSSKLYNCMVSTNSAVSKHTVA